MKGRTAYCCYRLAAALSRNLPRNMAYWVGLRLGDAWFACHGTKRKAVKANLAQVAAGRGVRLARGALDRQARKSFQYFGKYMVDFFRYEHLTRSEAEKLVSIEGGELLQEALAGGRGVILATAHLGNWELGGAVLAALGIPIHAVYRPQQRRLVDRFFQKYRDARGLQPLPLGAAMPDVLRCLRARHVVALLADRDFSHRSDRMPFFGRPARLPLGPAVLACRTRAPLVPAFLLREPDDTFRLRFHPPLVPGRSERPRDLQRRLIAILEREIAAAPCQWFVFKDFWESQP